MGWESIWGRERGATGSAAALSFLFFAWMATGCGMPGAPQPPSLHLPEPVTDLSASRSGDQVTLTWTMPRRNTDRILLKGPIEARVCRRGSAQSECATAGSVKFAPGTDAAFSESLPAELAAGAPRVVSYFVELDNAKGRSAGPSNAAVVPAGAAPAAVEGLHAEMRRDGVLLEWTPAAEGSEPAEVRLERTLLTPPPKNQEKSGTNPLAAPPEPVEQNLLVAGAERGSALDKDIRFGESYAYRAERVAEVTADGEKLEPQKLELVGPLSAPVRIDAKQEFPPAVPTGVAAVATASENGAPAAIDLSWQPNTEPDLAGYAIYRCELAAADECGGSNQIAWERISGAQPVAAPGFHDAHVAPGHTYAYAVSAIDQEGHESARSAQAQETVPNS